MRALVIGLAALSLGGCTTTVSDPGQAVPESNAVPPVACDAARAEAYVGRNGPAIAEEARAAAGAKSVRVIGPNQAVTQDYRSDRLNIATDAAGIVTRVNCG